MKDYRKLYKEYYGIEFGKEFAIHHIDGNRNNNEISNLLLLPLSLHSKYHAYKFEFESCCEYKLECGLTYGDMMARSLQLFYFDRLYSVLQEINFWIEQKQLADMKISTAYFMFRKENK